MNIAHRGSRSVQGRRARKGTGFSIRCLAFAVSVIGGGLLGTLHAQPVPSLFPQQPAPAAAFDPTSFTGEWVRPGFIRDGIARIVFEQTGTSVRAAVELIEPFRNIDGTVLLEAARYELRGTIGADGKLNFTFGPFTGEMSLGRTGQHISGSMNSEGGPFLGFPITLERRAGPIAAMALHFDVPLRRPRPITAGQVDAFLDHLGGMLQSAADAPEPRILTPLQYAYPDEVQAWSEQPSWHQAAELARSVYEQVRALQTQANRGVVPLNADQIKRLKAFLHWVDWLIKRGEHNVASFNVRTPEGQTLRVLHWEVPGGVMGSHWEEFPDAPEFPLDEPISGDVPPPNLRDIVDEDDATIYQEEYAKAFVKTIAQCADIYFTYGLIYSTYLYLNDDDEVAPLMLSILCYVNRAGPVLAAIIGTAYGASHWNELSPDQQIGLVSAAFLTGVHAARSRAAPAERADSTLAVNESPIPRAIPDRPAGDYSLRINRRSGSQGELAEIEATVPGSIEGRPSGLDSPVTLQARGSRVGATEQFFLSETGEPIIPAGEAGYQAWLTLTGRHYGQNTGRSPLLQALKGTSYEAEAQALVDAFLQPQAERVILNQRYVDLLNKLVGDESIPRTSGYYPDGPGTASNANYSLQVKNSANEFHIVEVAIEPSGQVVKVSVVPPGPGKPPTPAAMPPESSTPPPEQIPPGAPGSPEHMASRWQAYQQRGGTWSFDHWKKIYQLNMARATQAHQAVEAYHQQLGWGRREVTLDVEGIPRRLDIADVPTRRGVEYKTGYQSLNKDNLWELTRDELLVKQGWEMEWVFEGWASKPLLAALENAGIKFTFR